MALYFKNDLVDQRFVSFAHHPAYNFPLNNFTLETRIKTTTGGIVIQRKDPNDPNKVHFRLRVLPDNSVSFLISDGTTTREGKVDAEMIRHPGGGPHIQLTDGKWHHLAAGEANGRLVVYVDGCIFPASQHFPNEHFHYNFEYPVYLGATWEDTEEDPDTFFIGQLDDVRIWNQKLNFRDLKKRKDFRLVGTERGLVGYWPLDDDEIKDYSPVHNPNTVMEATELVDSPSIPVINGPYLKAFSDLVRDYQLPTDGESKKPEKIAAYQTRIYQCSHDGNALRGPLKVWAEGKVKVDYQGKIHEIDANTPLEVNSDANGLVLFNVIADTKHHLHLPVLKVWAGFMHAHERLFLACDAAFHHRLETMSIEEFQKPRDERPALMPTERYTHDHVKAVKHTIDYMLGGAAVQEKHNKARGLPDRVLPSKLLSRSVHWHQDPNLLIPGVDLKTGEIWVGHGRHDGHSGRELGLLMPELHRESDAVDAPGVASEIGSAHFEITFHHTDSIDETDPGLRPEYKSHNENSYAERWKELNPRVNEASVEGSFWDWFVNATEKATAALVKVVKKVVRDAVTGLKKIIKTITATIELIGKQAEQFIVRTVEEAASFVAGVFRQIGIAIGKVFDFFCQLFNGGDIVLTKRVLKAFVNKSFDHFGDMITEWEELGDKFFDDAKKEVGKRFDQLSESLTHPNHQSGFKNSSPAHRQPGVQNHWMEHKMVAHLSKSEWKNPKIVASIQSMETQAKSAFEKILEPLIDKEVFKSFGEIWNELSTAIHNPYEAIPHLVKALVEGLKAVTLVTIDVAHVIFNALLELAKGILNQIKSLLNETIYIPLISEIYRMWVPGSDLSLLEVSCLMFALPGTLLYKLFHANEAPFTKDEVDKFEKMTFEEMRKFFVGGSEASVRSGTFKTVMTYIYEASNTINAGLEFIDDAVNLSELNQGNVTKGWQSLSTVAENAKGFQSKLFPKCLKKMALILVKKIPAIICSTISGILQYFSKKPPSVVEWIQWGFGILSNVTDTLLSLLEESFHNLPNWILDILVGSSWSDGVRKLEKLSGLIMAWVNGAINLVFSIVVMVDEISRRKPAERIICVLAMNLLSGVPAMAKVLGTPKLVEASDGITGFILLGVDAGCFAARGALAGILNAMPDEPT